MQMSHPTLGFEGKGQKFQPQFRKIIEGAFTGALIMALRDVGAAREIDTAEGSWVLHMDGVGSQTKIGLGARAWVLRDHS